MIVVDAVGGMPVLEGMAEESEYVLDLVVRLRHQILVLCFPFQPFFALILADLLAEIETFFLQPSYRRCRNKTHHPHLALEIVLHEIE